MAGAFKVRSEEVGRRTANAPVEVTRLGGSYVLIIRLAQARRIEVGALGRIAFEAGGYAYVGSAMRGLDARIGRHLRDERKLHWHIDYLLEHGEVVDVVRVESDERLECRIARALSERLDGVRAFGCSDCRCASHLFGPREVAVVREAVVSAVADVTSMRNTWG